mgnify:CR=1 FL=1
MPCLRRRSVQSRSQASDAVKVLWKNGIYAESGMGCTGPIVRMAADKKEKAVELLTAAGYIG